MSLLNDALRAAEERQNRPAVATAYTGHPTPQPASQSKMLVLLVFVILLLLAGAAIAWWLWPEARNSAPPINGAEANAGEIIRPPEIVPEVLATAPAPEIAVVQVPQPAESSMVQLASEKPVREQAPAPQAQSKTKAETQTQTQTASEVEAVPRDVATSNPRPKEPASPVVAQQSAEQDQAAGAENRVPETQVKQQRETPAAVDLRTTRQMEKLLATGWTGEAERLLAEVSARQPAPNSREVFAREMLVQGMPERALNWLPEAVAIDYASLRLLRARALLERGELLLAVDTLASKVPPVADQPDYRVTLATLLQQAGQADEAAGHWSELIAYDDSQATWWLGLAIALETGGRINSAVRAYAQAAVLPGLAPSLADYARERLNALQAGS